MPSLGFDTTSTREPSDSVTRVPGSRTRTLIIALMPSPPSASEEERQVLGQQHVLIEHDLPPADLPAAVDATERVLALADEDVGLRLHAVPVDQEPALDHDVRGRHHGRLDGEKLNVGDH